MILTHFLSENQEIMATSETLIKGTIISWLLALQGNKLSTQNMHLRVD